MALDGPGGPPVPGAGRQGAGDGEQAVERLAWSRYEPAGPPQLVLLDLKMPRMDGLEVLRRVRPDEAGRGLPVDVFANALAA